MKRDEMTIAVMGDIGSVMGYRGLGFQVYPIEDLSLAPTELERLIATQKFAVIFLTEEVYTACEDVIKAHSNDFLPALVSITSGGAGENLGLRMMEDTVRRAVGFDILSRKQQKETESRDAQ